MSELLFILCLPVAVMYTCFNNSISGYFAFVFHRLISLALSLLPCDNAQKKQTVLIWERFTKSSFRFTYNIDRTLGARSAWSKTHVFYHSNIELKRVLLFFSTLPLYNKANEEA